MSKLKDLHAYLDQRLRSPLPGIDIQRRMMAKPKSDFRFSLGARESARPSGVLMMFYEQEGEIKMPLILRHDYDGVHSGQVSLPGGRREEEDSTIVDTALRETEEEIGMNRSHIEVVGQLTELYIPVSNHLVFPVVAVTYAPPIFVKEEREVSKIIEAKLSDLMHPEKEKERTIEIRDYSIEAPYFDLNGEVVWGATAMMLSELKELLGEYPFLE